MDAPQSNTAIPASYVQDDEISLAEIILFVSKYWLFVIIPGVIAAVGCAVYFTSLPVEYEATVTLIIAPARTGEVNRPTLNVQAYQKLIESEAIKRHAAMQLIKDGVLPDSKQPSIKGLTRIIPATRPDESAVLEAIGTGSSPEEAAKITNVWVKTFLDHVQKTVTDTNTVAGTVMLAQLNTAKQELSKQEDERTALTQRLDKEFQETQQKLELAIIEARTKSADKIAVYNAESAAKNHAVVAELNLDGRKAELTALRGVLLKLQQEQVELGPQLSMRKLQLDALRKSVDQTSPTIPLRRTIGDEALWNTVGGKKNIDWSALQKQVLVSDAPNPVFNELSNQLAEQDVFVQSRTPRLEQLQKEIDAMVAQIQKRDADLARDQSKMQALEIERELGLYKLKETTQLDIANAERSRDEGLKSLENAHEELKLRAERVLLPQREHTQQLARNWNNILQAKGTEEITDLRVGADAVEPGGPVAKKAMLYSVAAAVAGAMAGLLIALILHVRKTQAAKQPA